MPQITAYVLNDGVAAQTYTPVMDGSTSKWEARTASDFMHLQPKLQVEVRNAANATAPRRVVIGLGYPVEDGSDPALLNHVNSVQVVFNQAQNSSVASRALVLNTLIELLSESDFQNSIKNIEPFF